MMASAIHRHESAMGRLVSPPGLPSRPPPPHPPLQVVTEHQPWVPCIRHQAPAGYVSHMVICVCVYFSAFLSNHPTLPSPCLCLRCCPACGLISTICLDSIVVESLIHVGFFAAWLRGLCSESTCLVNRRPCVQSQWGLRQHCWASLLAQTERICLQYSRPGLNPWVWKIPWSRKWQHTPGLQRVRLD